ncbi:MAG: zf-TFIIB domain-containing protein [Bacteroidota bacterium]
MDCPHCRVPLAMTERQGVEVDYCPQCRGVWLDRGELDKIIERSVRPLEAPPAPPPQQPGNAWAKSHDDHQGQSHDKGDHHREQYGQYGHKPHKRKSFLEDIFDF